MPGISDQYNVINNIILTEQGSTPATPPSGKQRLYTTTSGLKIVNSAGTSSLLSLGQTARVYNNANQSIPNGWPSTKLNFNSERWDTDGIHSTSVNTDRLTCVTAGYYIVDAHVSFDSNTTGFRQVFIMQNDTNYIAVQDSPARSAGDTEISISTTVYLSAGDYVTVWVTQNSGGALNVKLSDSGINRYSTEFSMIRVG